MFENLLNQDITHSLISDIKHNRFPQSVLFSGEQSCGKLTAALEVARVFSCKLEKKGEWKCDCPSCLQHKALICTNMLLLGSRDCSLEIAATKDIFLKAIKENPPYLVASRYAFIRSVRKLTLRFNEILWNDNKDVKKIASLMESINEDLELLDFPRELPEISEVEKICENVQKNSIILENTYLYDSIPIDQIRNMENWAHTKSEEGKKTIIIENVDKMLESARNALLKILEEPPKDCIFILLTSKRNSVMQTILSRVRTYNFYSRTLENQQKVINTIFRNSQFNGSINEYLLTYLPVPASEIRENSKEFYTTLINGHIPDISAIVKKCNSFSPRIELKIFLEYISNLQKKLLKSEQGIEACNECSKVLRDCYQNVSLYNLNPVSALEILVREISRINFTYGKVLCADM